MSSEKVNDERKIDLTNNVQARIQNPLHGISRGTLLDQVEDFAREKDLLDVVDILKKGALLAQNPKDFENIPELDEKDKEVIRRETTRILLSFHPPIPWSSHHFSPDRWSQPYPLYMTVVVCSLAAAVQYVPLDSCG